MVARREVKTLVAAGMPKKWIICRAFLAVALIRRIPDAFIVAQRPHHAADIVATEDAQRVAAAMVFKEMREQCVLRALVHGIERHLRY